MMLTLCVGSPIYLEGTGGLEGTWAMHWLVVV